MRPRRRRWASSRAISASAATGSVSRRVTSAAEACAGPRPGTRRPPRWRRRSSGRRPPSGSGPAPPGARSTEISYGRGSIRRGRRPLDFLVVADGKLDDASAHLRRDPHEIGAHRGVIRLRPRLPLEQRHGHGDDGGADDPRAEHDRTDGRGDAPRSCRRLDERPLARCMAQHPEERHPEDRVTRRARLG